jgi:hypothetical protein
MEAGCLTPREDVFVAENSLVGGASPTKNDGSRLYQTSIFG